MSKKTQCLIVASGGYGQHVMRLAEVPDLKKKYDEIYVVSPYSEVWATQDLNGVYMQAPASLYSQLIMDNDELDIFADTPYNQTEFIQKKLHFNQANRKMMGLPDISLEEAMAELPDFSKMTQVYPQIEADAKQTYENLLKEHKDKKYIVLVQSWGGQSGLTNPMEVQPIGNEPLIRNWKFFDRFMEEMAKKYPKTLFVHYRLPQEKALPETVSVERPALWYREFAKYCSGAICIDSSLQHILCGQLKSAVLWLETRPENFGHSFHFNVNACENDLTKEEPYFSIIQNRPAIIRYTGVEKMFEKLNPYFEEIGIK